MDSNVIRGLSYQRDSSDNFVAFDKNIIVRFATLPADADGVITVDEVEVPLTDSQFLLRKNGEAYTVTPTISPSFAEVLKTKVAIVGNTGSDRNEGFLFKRLLSTPGISYSIKSNGKDIIESAGIRSLFRLREAFKDVTITYDDNTAGGTGLARGENDYQNLYSVTPKLHKKHGDSLKVQTNNVRLGDTIDVANLDDIKDCVFTFVVRCYYNKVELGLK